jgi:hypothetical protein
VLENAFAETPERAVLESQLLRLGLSELIKNEWLRLLYNERHWGSWQILLLLFMPAVKQLQILKCNRLNTRARLVLHQLPDGILSLIIVLRRRHSADYIGNALFDMIRPITLRTLPGLKHLDTSTGVSHWMLSLPVPSSHAQELSGVV